MSTAADISMGGFVLAGFCAAVFGIVTMHKSCMHADEVQEQARPAVIKACEQACGEAGVRAVYAECQCKAKER